MKEKCLVWYIILFSQETSLCYIFFLQCIFVLVKIHSFRYWGKFLPRPLLSTFPNSSFCCMRVCNCHCRCVLIFFRLSGWVCIRHGRCFSILSARMFVFVSACVFIFVPSFFKLICLFVSSIILAFVSRYVFFVHACLGLYMCVEFSFC